MVDDYQRTGLRGVGTPDRLGQREAGRDGDGPPGESPGLEARQPLPDPGGAQRLPGAHPHERCDDGQPGCIEDLSLVPGTGQHGQRDDQHRDREHPPGPGGEHRGGSRPAGDLPHSGPEHPAAIQRQAGHEVEHADQQIDPDQPLDQQVRQAAGMDGDEQSVSGRRQRQGHRWAGRGHQEFLAGSRWLLLDLGETAERVKQDPAYRKAESPGHDRMTEFVHQDGAVEQHDDGDCHHVTQVAGPGN